MALNRKNLALLSILVLAALLRIYALESESIWIDEGITVELCNLNIPDLLTRLKVGDYHPPLYFVIMNYWAGFFGTSEFFIRFPAVLFGFFSVLMIYKVAHLLYDRNVGLMSSLLLSLSLFHIHYSQEARAYTLVALLTLVSFYFLLRLIKGSNFWMSIGYVMSASFLTYSHNLGLFVIAVQNIYFITMLLVGKENFKRNFKRWFLVQIVLATLYLPWIPILSSQLTHVRSGFWVSKPTVFEILITFAAYASYSPVLLLLFALFSLLSVISLRSIDDGQSPEGFLWSLKIKSFLIKLDSSNFEGTYLCLIWLLVPILLPFFLSLLFSPIYLHRITIPASLAFYILIARGIERMESKSIKSIGLVLIIVFSLFQVFNNYYTKTNKADWRQVADFVDSNATEGDLLLLFPPWTRNLVFDYYSIRTDLTKVPLSKDAKGYFKGKKRELEQFLPDFDRVWVIFYIENNNEVLRQIEKSFRQSFQKRYEHYSPSGRKHMDINLSLYVRK